MNDRALAKFRKNAGIVLINADGLVFAGERIDIKNAWQLPQGGIDKGEAPLAAAWRELQEETGVTQAEATLVMEHPEWLTYEWEHKVGWADDGIIGQAQKWFLFRFTGNNIDLTNAVDDEFQSWQWVTADWLYDTVIDFRKPVYKQVFNAFSAHLS